MVDRVAPRNPEPGDPFAGPPQQGDYGTSSRPELVEFLPDVARSIVDIGCAQGGFGPTLRAKYGAGATIVGIDPVPSQTATARLNGAYDEVFDGYFPAAFPPAERAHDLLTFNDVLEHTVDPWALLAECHSYLTDGGRILAVIPSTQYAPVLWRLIRGRWDYADWGTLDRTHLRFFTRSTAVEMFEGAGYEVERCAMIGSIADIWNSEPSFARRWAKRAVLPFLGDAAYLWIVIVARSGR